MIYFYFRTKEIIKAKIIMKIQDIIIANAPHESYILIQIFRA